MPESRRDPVQHSLVELVEIADLIDCVCEGLAVHKAGRPADEVPLRRALFALLDHPTQALWEELREEWIAPNFIRGLSAPIGEPEIPVAPMLSFADACYAYGLPDTVCPSKQSLRAILRWANSQAA
jgi:hypothetical protein